MGCKWGEMGWNARRGGGADRRDGKGKTLPLINADERGSEKQTYHGGADTRRTSGIAVIARDCRHRRNREGKPLPQIDVDGCRLGREDLIGTNPRQIGMPWG